jgi:hypothetical protein
VGLLAIKNFLYLTKPNPKNVWGWFKRGETFHLEKFFLMPDIQLTVLRNTSIVHNGEWKMENAGIPLNVLHC